MDIPFVIFSKSVPLFDLYKPFVVPIQILPLLIWMEYIAPANCLIWTKLIPSVLLYKSPKSSTYIVPSEEIATVDIYKPPNGVLTKSMPLSLFHKPFFWVPI